MFNTEETTDTINICFYDNVLETWMLSFFSMLTLVRLAEIPWIWVDTPAKQSLKAEKGSTDE